MRCKRHEHARISIWGVMRETSLSHNRMHRCIDASLLCFCARARACARVNENCHIMCRHWVNVLQRGSVSPFSVRRVLGGERGRWAGGKIHQFRRSNSYRYSVVCKAGKAARERHSVCVVRSEREGGEGGGEHILQRREGHADPEAQTGSKPRARAGGRREARAASTAATPAASPTGKLTQHVLVP